MKTMEKQLEEFGVVPVVVLEDVKDALPLADALVKGGLPCAEVTFRTEAAKESIRRMTEQYPDMLVGAGTVLTVEQVKQAVDAEAKFIGKKHSGISGLYYSFRSGTGSKERTSGGKVLSGRAVWRSIDNQSAGGAVYNNKVYADRRGKRKKPERLSGLQQNRMLRRKLDGERKFNQRGKI